MSQIHNKKIAFRRHAFIDIFRYFSLKGAAGLCLAFFLCIIPVSGKDNKIEFNAQKAMEYVQDLASDQMLGRKSGQKGGVLGEEYIASRLKEWGVEPGGENGTYFHHFRFNHVDLESGPSLEIESKEKKRNFWYKDGWRVWRYSGSGNFKSEIIFVGYGIHAPEKGYDDFADLDLKGKIAFLILETSHSLNERLGKKVEIQNRVKAIQNQGAFGVMMCPSPERGNRAILGGLDGNCYDAEFVILRIESNVADFVFKDCDTELPYLVQKMDKQQRPLTYRTGVLASVFVKAMFDPHRPARNVMGRITGNDPILKDEYIIIAAHMDHLGINPWGEVFNGANDNASGTAVAMEIARVLSLQKVKLKRTVIFFLWAAEEQGFTGLKEYCKRPVYPLEKTVLYMTMDMVGHGNGKVKVSGAHYRPDLWEFLNKNISPEVLEHIIQNPKFSRRLPNWEPLLPTGVARMGFHTDGYHFKYHQSRDDADLIQPELLKRTGDFILESVMLLGNDPGNWIPPFRREDYYLKVVGAVGFKPLSIPEINGFGNKDKDSRLDIQLLEISGNTAEGDKFRVDVIKKTIEAFDAIRKSPNLSLFSSRRNVSQEIRQKKTVIIPGIRGFNLFWDDLEWIDVLSRQGIRFIRAESPSFLFDHQGLTKKAMTMLESLKRSGIVLIVSGLEDNQTRWIVESSNAPSIIIDNALPEPDVLKMIAKKNGLFGFVLEEINLAGYPENLLEAQNDLGSEHLMVVLNQNTWEDKGKEQMRMILSHLLKSGQEWPDLLNVFSGSFLSLLDHARQ